MKISFDRGRYAPATRSAYTVAWQDWERWCADTGDTPLPADPAAIARFLTDRAATHSTSTIQIRLGAIKAAHELSGQPLNVKASEIRDAWAEIRRTKGTASKPKDALAIDEIKRVVRCIPPNRLQDRAVLLIGFASVMRRSELAALNVEDLQFNGDLIITIRRSKTDKGGAGATVAVARTNSELCPVAALEAWLAHSGITEGAVFRSRAGDRMVPRKVADIAKQWAKKAGYDPAKIGAHSLRRGGITSMFMAGGDLKSIMGVSRHSSSDMALRYVQAETAQNNPAIRLLKL